MNEISVIKSNSLKTDIWSGGKTTELYIYPEGSDFPIRNFLYRLSTATIETNTSKFTQFPGFYRKLMVLDGKITLTHKNHHQKKLNRFDIDEFFGDWETESKGKCRDFNLIAKPEVKSDIRVFQMEKNEEIYHKISAEWNRCFIYQYLGNSMLTLEDQEENISAEDVCVFKLTNPSILQMVALSASEIILVKLSI